MQIIIVIFPLVAKVIDPDPAPPKRIFQRPPVRLIHDVVVAAHNNNKFIVILIVIIKTTIIVVVVMISN